MSELNWKGRLHHVALAMHAQAVSPLRHSLVSLDRPVFIWGSGQSGTFLLYDLVAALGGFAYHSVQSARKKGLAARAIGKHAFPNGYPNEGLLRFWSGCGLPFEGNTGWTFRTVLTGEDAMRVDVRKVRMNYRQAATAWRWQGRTAPLRILDKCPFYTFMILAIDRAFPDALHIFCVRDPKAVVASIARRFRDPSSEPSWRGYPSGWFGDVMLPGHERLQNASIEDRHTWQVGQILNIGNQAAQRLGPRCLISHHEDLLRDPEAELKTIARFIGARVPLQMPAILAAGVTRNRNAAPADDAREPRSRLRRG